MIEDCAPAAPRRLFSFVLSACEYCPAWLNGSTTKSTSATASGAHGIAFSLTIASAAHSSSNNTQLSTRKQSKRPRWGSPQS